jgi:methyl-accepting chemotaxis protein
MKFANLKIGVKIYLGFLIVLVIFMLSSGYLILQIGTLGELQDAGAKRTEDVLEIKDITNRVGEVYPVMADAVINRDLNATRKDFAELKANADRDIQRVLKLVDTTEERALAETFSTQYHSYLDLFEKQMLPILEKSPDRKIAMASDDEQKIRELDDAVDTLREATQTPLAQINKSLTQETQQADQLFDLTRREMTYATLILSLLGLGIAAFTAFLMSPRKTKLGNYCRPCKPCDTAQDYRRRCHPIHHEVAQGSSRSGATHRTTSLGAGRNRLQHGGTDQHG